jgi:hypothetical protein
MPEINRFPSIPTKFLLPIDFSPSSQAPASSLSLANYDMICFEIFG